MLWEKKMLKRFVEFANAHSWEGKLSINQPIKQYTTFQIGGLADAIFEPNDVVELQEAVHFLYSNSIPYTVLGKGSNMLVSDKGIRGVVIVLADNLSAIHVAGNTLIAQAGASMCDVSNAAAENALVGLEFAVGIPGSIGGGVFMNAGAYDGDFSSVVSSVTTIDAKGILRVYSNTEAQFGYRHSVFQDSKEIICQATFELPFGNKCEIKEKIKVLTEKRECKQPLEMPSAGSVFKRPVGYFAGTLIEQAGLKGYTIGGAQVSTKHAGFIVNVGGATAQEVLHLIAYVQRVVQEKFGVYLESEVRFIGEK